MMRFMDGFDYYSAAQFGRKWDSGAVALVTGVYGTGKALQLGAFASGNATKTLASNFTTGFCGFHFFFPGGALTLLRMLDAGTIQLELRTDATGALFFTRNGTLLGAASTNRLVAGNWYWLETKATIDPTVGTVEVRVNGATSGWVALTGQNTRATANSFFNQLSLNALGQTYDSFHFWDATGTFNNTFMGEHAIATLLPNSVGSNAAWTKGGSTINANNYQQVNENPADDDVSYVGSNVAGNIDSYGFVALTQATGTIAAIATNTVDRVDDASPHVLHHYTKSGATTAESADIVPSATYNNHQSILEVDPNTSAPFTIAAANAAERGPKLVS